MINYGVIIYYKRDNFDIVHINYGGSFYAPINRVEFDFAHMLINYSKSEIGIIELPFGEFEKNLLLNKANKVRVVGGVLEYYYEEEIPKKSRLDVLEEDVENMKIDNALAIAEVIEKGESDKLELSEAIAETIELITGGIDESVVNDNTDSTNNSVHNV